MDLVVLTGQHRNTPTPPEATIRLYHTNRDGTFKDITAQSGSAAPKSGPSASLSLTTTTMDSTTFS